MAFNKKLSENMVSTKAFENEKLVKAINSLNLKFNTTVKDLSETKRNISALSDQLTIVQEKKKTLKLERDGLLKEKKLSDEAASTLQNQLASFEKEKEKACVEHASQIPTSLYDGS